MRDSSHGEENLFVFLKIIFLNLVSCKRPADYSCCLVCQGAQNIVELECQKFMVLIFVQQSVVFLGASV